MNQSRVDGLEETLAVLSLLPQKVQGATVRRGLTRGAAIVRDEARYRAPRKTGQLAAAITSGSSRKNEDGTYSVRVYVDDRKAHGFLGYFFEYGIDPHYITAGSASFGGVAASPRKLTQRVAREGESDTASGKLKIGNQLVSGAVLHPGVSPRPFLRPALDIKSEEVFRAIAFEIEETVFNLTGFQAAA